MTIWRAMSSPLLLERLKIENQMFGHQNKEKNERKHQSPSSRVVETVSTVLYSVVLSTYSNRGFDLMVCRF